MAIAHKKGTGTRTRRGREEKTTCNNPIGTNRENAVRQTHYLVGSPSGLPKKSAINWSKNSASNWRPSASSRERSKATKLSSGCARKACAPLGRITRCKWRVPGKSNSRRKPSKKRQIMSAERWPNCYAMVAKAKVPTVGARNVPWKAKTPPEHFGQLNAHSAARARPTFWHRPSDQLGTNGRFRCLPRLQFLLKHCKMNGTFWVIAQAKHPLFELSCLSSVFSPGPEGVPSSVAIVLGKTSDRSQM